MDAAYQISDKVLLITPARFLFNAGKTPKEWNKKMLEDEHFKVLLYKQNSDEVFANTDIKGGVAITYRSKTENFGMIEIFTQYEKLNTILLKVKKISTQYLDSIVYAPESYKFTDILHTSMASIEGKLSKGHKYDITSNIFEKLNSIVFFDSKPNDGQEYIQMLGRKNNKRCLKWIMKKYVAKHDNLDKYKLAFPKVNGSGDFGEVLTAPEVIGPGIGHTQTFLSMGTYDTKLEVENLSKYLKSKFARTMLGILKVTQDNKKSVWKYVPLQDFTSKSDIDWTLSVADIDKQLYKKYGLTAEEIEFIETHVKEMV